MVIVNKDKMNVFTLNKAAEHFPEMHVVFTSDDECSCYIRTPTGQVYLLQIAKGTTNLDEFLDGFADLVTWFYTDITEMRKRLWV
jgi:hypothetical protein